MHCPDILGHLKHSRNAVWVKDVVFPSVEWRHVRQIHWIGGDYRRRNSGAQRRRSSARRRRKSLHIFCVFVNGESCSECTNGGKVGCNEVVVKIVEPLADLIVRLFALGVEAEGGCVE